MVLNDDKGSKVTHSHYDHVQILLVAIGDEELEELTASNEEKAFDENCEHHQVALSIDFSDLNEESHDCKYLIEGNSELQLLLSIPILD